MATKLSAKQAAFVAEYLIDLNASAAALRAGYSPKTAGAIGHENLKKPKIAALIEAAQAERAEQAGITAQDVITNLHRIATGEDNYETINGLGIDVTHHPRYSDRIKAWELIGKHLGMFTDRVDVTSDGEKLAGPIVNVYLPSNGRDS